MGEALDTILDYNHCHGIRKAHCVEADPSDIQNLPITVIPIQNGEVYASDTTHSSPYEESYYLPYGVIHSRSQGEYDPDQIRPGYAFSQENGLMEVQAVVAEPRLLPVYLNLISVLPDIKVFWIKLQEDWENAGTEEFYANEDLNSQSKIEKFIKSNNNDTLCNGHVTLTAYSNAGQTNLNVTDHKTIQILTYDKSLRTQLCRILEEFNLKKKRNLLSVERGFYHWHYRPANSMNRTQLIKHLKNSGFKSWSPDEKI